MENGKTQANLVTSPCFIVDKFHFSRPWEFRRPRHAKRSVWCLVAVRGYGVIESAGATPVAFSSGQAVVIPASVERFTLKPQWELEFLSRRSRGSGHPETVLLEATAGSI